MNTKESTNNKSKTTDNKPDDRYVDIKYLSHYMGISQQWIYVQIRNGNFPQPTKFGSRSMWLFSEVLDWIKMRKEQ